MTKISTAAANGEAISRYITKDGLQGIKAISKNNNKEKESASKCCCQLQAICCH
jgi:hypothetical protein